MKNSDKAQPPDSTVWECRAQVRPVLVSAVCDPSGKAVRRWGKLARLTCSRLYHPLESQYLHRTCLPEVLTKPSLRAASSRPRSVSAQTAKCSSRAHSPSPRRKELRQGRGSLGIRSPSFPSPNCSSSCDNSVSATGGACFGWGPAQGSLPVSMQQEHWLNSKSKQQLSPPLLCHPLPSLCSSES